MPPKSTILAHFLVSNFAPMPRWEAGHNTSAALALAGHVALAKPIAAVGDGEFAVLGDRGTDPIPFAFRGFFEVRDHVFRGIVVGVLVHQRQVLLPDAFDSR
jgi:hypothetical protein